MGRIVAGRPVDAGRDESAPRRPRRGGVVTDHFATLRGTRGRILWRQVFTQFVVPVGLAVGLVYVQFRITIVTDLIAGFAVLAGFLFGLVIFVFQLRLGMSTDPRVQSKANLPTLIDELFSNVLYAVGVAFGLILLMVVAAATEPHDDKGVALGLDPWMSAAVVLVGVHLLAVIGMCMKRTRRAYLELKS